MPDYPIAEMLQRIEKTMRSYPKAAMFDLAEQGYSGAFEQLMACLISIRTKDEVSLPAAIRLLDAARTPAQMAELPVERIDELINPSTFHTAKAYQMQAIARQIVEQHNGELPCDETVLLSFKGVGPKCANLVLGIACAGSKISVDVHVWRVTNRWGLIAEKTPERAMTALEALIPPEYWVDVNRLLMPFGKQVCTGVLPHCSTCPVLEFCQQVGVTKHR